MAPFSLLHRASRSGSFPNQDDAESQAHEVDYNNANLLHEYHYLPGQLHHVWNRLNADFGNFDNEEGDYYVVDAAGLKTRGCASVAQSLNGLNTRPGYANFTNAVTTRDVGTCGFSGENAPIFVQKAHILPFSKGSEVSIVSGFPLLDADLLYLKYMEKLVNPRAETIAGQLDGIDDVRNGIVLNLQTHALQGVGMASFLRVRFYYYYFDGVARLPCYRSQTFTCRKMT